jgi:hypothetical protein
MAYRRVDPAALAGEELDIWYRRTPDEIEEERRLRADEAYQEFFGDGRWQEAKAPRGRRASLRPARPSSGSDLR